MPEKPPTQPELEDPFDELDPVNNAGQPAPPLPAPVSEESEVSDPNPRIDIAEVPTVDETPEPNIDEKQSKPSQKRERRSFQLPAFLSIRNGIIALIFIIVCAVIVIAAAQFLQPGTDGTTESPIEQLLGDPEPVDTSGSTEAPAIVRDSDGDGLLDEEEATLGTDPDNVDTDSDGLSDRQELRIYQTNPTDPDSDNDGYNDGEEVRGFYNPNGSGTMIDVEEAIEQFENEQ